MILSTEPYRAIAPAQADPHTLTLLSVQVFLRKLKKALAKSQPEVASKLKDSAPVLTLHHIVKERCVGPP